MPDLARPKIAIQIKCKNTHYYNQQEIDTLANYKSHHIYKIHYTTKQGLPILKCE